MKASREWLEEYSEINVSTTELGDILTMTGSKVETIEQKGNDIKNVVVGKILEIKKHEDSDHLLVTKVDLGNEKVQIVTGAPNIKEGDIVPIAKDGSSLPGGVQIKKGMLRGVESCGMMCSIGELGLEHCDYPEQIENGIMILDKSMENELGKDIVEVLDLKEDIIDFEITSNRPDCLSIEGLGRETAVSLGKEFKNPRKNIDELKVEDKKELEGLKVDITAPDLCYRYVARVIKNTKIAPSPNWLKRRLKACGIRSINNIVDITNYVMLEMGQPMHAFDINSIEGKHITVRRAKNGEKITTLDEQERILDENDLVISDEKKAVAIAGVMGGLNSEIEEDTNTVVFESAVFYGGSVRKTAKKVGLRTESSSRFEKGLSAENALRAVNRAVELVELLGAGTPVDGKIDVYPTKQKINQIKFDDEKINKLLGTNISKQEMIKILENLEIKVEDGVAISPYFRMDIEQLADIAEEVARFYGYDKLETTLLNAETTIGARNKEQKIDNKIKQILVSNGLSEIYTYGFVSEKDLEKANVDKALVDKAITLINPLSDEYKLMRPTTIPSMLQILAINANKKNQNVKLFDISRSYRNVNGEVESGEIPLQESILTIGMYGDDVDFYTLKGLIENVLEASDVNRYSVEKETKNNSFHPGRCANLKVGTDVIATIGEAHPEVLMNYNIEKRAYLAEINITKVVKYSRANKKYTEVPKFPAVERDIAVIVDESIEVGKIEGIITAKSKKILENVKLFDIYRDEKIGNGKKSVAYSMIFRDKRKTLNDEDVNSVMEKIISELENKLGATLRK
ncbi:MAG: phenylalanine--tRNA ligase subunit beta [Clostridia bacterium]|nr:phenylalanine--tRNA ligase subunit beta [Clostridia bacterium]